MKKQSIKTKRPLVEHKTGTNFNLISTKIGFCLFLPRLHPKLSAPRLHPTAPKLREIRENSGKVQKITDVSSKQLYSKS